MPATGKKFADESETLARIRNLEKAVYSPKKEREADDDGQTEELWVVTSITLDGAGHVTNWVSRKLIFEAGILTGIE